MMFLHFWLLYGEFECPLWIFGCRMVILNDCFSCLAALWRFWMTILHFWLPYGDFEWLVWIFGCPIAKLNELFILLHALSAKLDGKTYIKMKCNDKYKIIMRWGNLPWPWLRHWAVLENDFPFIMPRESKSFSSCPLIVRRWRLPYSCSSALLASFFSSKRSEVSFAIFTKSC